MKDHKVKKFYGTTTLGERGQVVIPVNAREDLELKAGDKLLTFCVGKEMVLLFKYSELEEYVSTLTEHLEELNEVIAKSRD